MTRPVTEIMAVSKMAELERAQGIKSFHSQVDSQPQIAGRFTANLNEFSDFIGRFTAKHNWFTADSERDVLQIFLK